MGTTHLLRDGFPACGAGLTGERVALDRNPGHVTCKECLEVAKGLRKPISELPLSEVIELKAFQPVDEPQQFEG